jgi:hypothetical protein
VEDLDVALSRRLLVQNVLVVLPNEWCKKEVIAMERKCWAWIVWSTCTNVVGGERSWMPNSQTFPSELDVTKLKVRK